MRKFIDRIFAVFALALVFAAGGVHAQLKPDSTQVTAQGPLTPSNCPNITTQWYASGSVPAGYYKSNADGNCYPIPACPSNQVWNKASQVCACSSGTSWDSSYSTCHVACGGGTSWNGSICASSCSPGTAWNGSTCASLCTGGQAWNGSACTCPVGTTWNGSTCGTPPAFTGFSASPTTQTIGSGDYILSWSASGSPTSGSVSCTGANGGSFALSPASGGSGKILVSAPGTTNCTGTLVNSYGSTTSTSLVLTASCPGGTSWSNLSCSSLCSGGQSWNGNACACPTGQVWNGSLCGIAPLFSSFGISPTAVNVGSNYGVSWGVLGSGPVTVALNCNGATSTSYTLSPPSGGSGVMTATAPGTTNCYASATSAWGTASASSGALTATCPGGTTWNGSRCAVTAPPACPANYWWDGTSCQPPRYATVTGFFGNRNRVPLMKVTAITTSNVVIETVGPTGAPVASCTLSTPGQFCHLTGFGTSGVNWMFDYCALQNWRGDCIGGPRYANEIVDQRLELVANSSRFGSVASARLEADGSVSLWFAYAGGSLDFYQSGIDAKRTSNSGVINVKTWQSWGTGTTHTVDMKLVYFGG